MPKVNFNFLGIFDSTHGQFGSTKSAGDASTIAKNVQSIGKTLMMNGDERDVEGDFMPDDVGIKHLFNNSYDEFI